MTKCYEHEECEFNGQPECRLPDGMECPHGVKADKPVAESKTDIEALIERLNQYSQSLIACHMGGEFSDMCVDAATALSTLQAENESLKEKLYDGEGVNLVYYWMQQGKIEENGHRNCQAENEKQRAELEQEHARRLHAEQHADAFLEDCKRLEAELEQVKRERDAIEQDFCVFTKQWLEEGSGFPCRWCKYENTGRC